MVVHADTDFLDDITGSLGEVLKSCLYDGAHSSYLLVTYSFVHITLVQV